MNTETGKEYKLINLNNIYIIKYIYKNCLKIVLQKGKINYTTIELSQLFGLISSELDLKPNTIIMHTVL